MDTRPANTLKPGDTFTHDGGVTVTVLREREPYSERIGGATFAYWCRREDTGAEGYVPFGERGVVVPA